MKQSSFPFSLNYAILGCIAALHLVALLVKGNTLLEWTVLGLIGITVAVLTYRSLFTGFLIAAVEIFIGGHGHLIHAPITGFSFSLRMIIFLAVMGSWLVLLIQKKIRFNFSLRTHYPFVILAAALILGVLVGLLRKNSIAAIFDDANSYATLALLFPLIGISWTEERKTQLLQALTTSAIWLSFVTIVLSFVFTHAGEHFTRPVYVFFRDTRLAEVTLQSVTNSSGLITHPLAARVLGDSGYWYRIFMQSHFFVVTTLLLIISYMMIAIQESRARVRHVSLVLILFGSTLLISQSRSFFAGLFVATMTIVIASFFLRRSDTQRGIGRLGILALLGLCAGVIMLFTIRFPLMVNPPVERALFYDTSLDTTRAAAVTSRWTLVHALNEKIITSPIIGSGFGAVLSYESDDPRVLDETGGTTLTTYRFEWGYHDIWIKMGILGIAAFVAYYFMITRQLMRSWSTVPRWLLIGILSGLIALGIAHIFSPYLNHPIGLLWLLCVIPFVYTEKTESVI